MVYIPFPVSATILLFFLTAVSQLARPAKLNEHVKTIPMAGPFENLPRGTNCSIAGWGCTVPGDNSSVVSRLREVDVEVLDDDKCTSAFYFPMLMLCAGRPQEGKDAAQGDSGSPLVCKDKVQGVVSKGSTSGTLPGTYTSVSFYNDWIKDTMRRA
uniref:Peptidase S1 domain-containing protein n=1 Tax=Pelodiscus sinensis TaxID=13735 RepID=K7FX47_PELSI